MSLRFTGRNLTLAALALLLLWLIFWLGWLVATSPAEHALWLALALPPIIIVAMAVRRDIKGGYVWCGFVSLGYFAQGMTVVLTSREYAMAGAVEIFLSLLLFTSTSAALRARH